MYTLQYYFLEISYLTLINEKLRKYFEFFKSISILRSLLVKLLVLRIQNL